MTVLASLTEAKLLYEKGLTHKALDVIFDVIDDHLLAGEFQKVDDALKGLDPTTLPIQLRIGVLTITLYANDRLPSRAEFFSRVERSLENEPSERRLALLSGLAR